VIRPLFRHYVFHPPEGTQALFDEKENLLSLKERRLDMFFIGETAGAELKGLMLDYVMRIDEITARRKKLDSLKE
jgi:hypothetical protein